MAVATTAKSRFKKGLGLILFCVCMVLLMIPVDWLIKRFLGPVVEEFVILVVLVLIFIPGYRFFRKHFG
jgi:hypothetical protein